MLIRNSSKSFSVTYAKIVSCRSGHLSTHFPVYMSSYRGAFASDVSPCGAEEDDITGILNVFCKHLAHDKSGKSVLKELFFKQLMYLTTVTLFICN
jgi:hypothetical protein